MAVQKTGATLRVIGLRELRRTLKEANDRSPKEIQEANKAAAQAVVRVARFLAPKGPHQGGGNVSPIVSSIKAQATSGKGIIAFGGTRSPHAPVYEFGGSIPRAHTRATHGGVIRTAQKKHLGFKFVGVSTTDIAKRPYIYPAIDATHDEVLDTYRRALLDITHDL